MGLLFSGLIFLYYHFNFDIVNIDIQFYTIYNNIRQTFRRRWMMFYGCKSRPNIRRIRPKCLPDFQKDEIILPPDCQNLDSDSWSICGASDDGGQDLCSYVNCELTSCPRRQPNSEYHCFGLIRVIRSDRQNLDPRIFGYRPEPIPPAWVNRLKLFFTIFF